MNLSRFQALIAAFGASSRRWPAAEREAARAYAEASPGALRAEAALDAALDLDRAPFDEERFVAAALAAAPLPGGRIFRFPSPRRRFALPAWALAACALAGVLVGLAAGHFAPSDDADRSVAAVFGAIGDSAAGESDG